MENNTQKSKKSGILRYVYIAFTIIIIALIGALDPDFVGMLDALETLNPLWILVCLVAVLCYWFTDALLVKHITSYLCDTRYNIWSSFKIGIIGLYYAALTPSSTGGQPFQVIYMKRDGIGAGIGTGIVSVKFIVYQLSLCSIYIAAMLTKVFGLFDIRNDLFFLATVGFIINLALVLFIGISILNRKFVDKCGFGIIRLLTRIRIIKNPDKATASLGKTFDEFHEAIRYMSQNKWKVFVSYLISIINLLFLFSISYLVYRAMGFNEAAFIEIAIMQAFLFLAVSFVPTPGSAGTSEGGFYLFFGHIFPSGKIFLGMLLWRFLTYYLILFAGCAVVMFCEFKTARQKKKANAALQNIAQEDATNL